MCLEFKDNFVAEILTSSRFYNFSKQKSNVSERKSRQPKNIKSQRHVLLYLNGASTAPAYDSLQRNIAQAFGEKKKYAHPMFFKIIN